MFERSPDVKMQRGNGRLEIEVTVSSCRPRLCQKVVAGVKLIISL